MDVMDGKHVNVTSELQHLQNSIASLFQGLINEKDRYKYEQERSVESLLKEVNNLRRENEDLRRSKTDINYSCDNCIELRKRLLVMDERWKKLKCKLKLLREFAYEASYTKMGFLNFSKLLMLQLDDLNNDDNLDSEIEHLEKMNLFSGSSSSGSNSCRSDQQPKENLTIDSDFHISKKSFQSGTKETCRSSDEEKKKDLLIKSVVQDKLNVNMQSDQMGANDDLESPKSSSFSNSTMLEFVTPKKLDKAGSSSFDSSSCKNLSLNKSDISPILLIDQRFLADKNSISAPPVCSTKRKAGAAHSISPIKIIEKQINRISAKQRKYASPAKGSLRKTYAPLRMTNSIEAEISMSGIRKLKQTQLNFEYFKKTNRGENKKEQIEDKSRKVLVNDSKCSEDDLIFESPKNSDKFLDDFKKNSKEDKIGGTVPGKNVEKGLDMDPEETFINSMYFKKEENIENENESIEENTVLPDHGGSPEYNTVQFPYKDDPTRKKSERMKLPGQMCTECDKYYKEVFGEIDPNKLQEILDRCSRHRDKHYNIVDTPPGYWKPYLTETMSEAGEQDDTLFEA